jgi:hypothetical protein
MLDMTAEEAHVAQPFVLRRQSFVFQHLVPMKLKADPKSLSVYVCVFLNVYVRSLFLFLGLCFVSESNPPTTNGSTRKSITLLL